MKLLLHFFTLFFIFFSVSVHAIELENEQFISNIDGWAKSQTDKVWHYAPNGGWMGIDENDWAKKTYSFGSGYANKSVIIEVRWWAPDEWESNEDFLRVKINGSTSSTDYNGGGTHTISFTANTDANGDLEIEFSPQTDNNNEDAYIDWFTISFDERSSCPGTAIPNLDGTNVTTSYDYTNWIDIDNYAHHYYHFTPTKAGTFQAVFDADDSNRNVEMYIKDGCSGSTLDSKTSDGDKTSDVINVNANQTIVVEIYRDFNNDMDYKIGFTYTVLVPEAVDDTANTGIDESITFNILDNDIAVVTNTVKRAGTEEINGTVSINTATGDITYTPDPSFEGTISFTYSVEDADGNALTALITINVFDDTSYDTGFQDFVLINPDDTRNLQGNYAIAGNTVMCLTEKTSDYGGSCQDAGAELSTSNNYVSKYIDIDGDNRTWNSTSSYIELPDTYLTKDINNIPVNGIAWAGLFWQGRISTDNAYKMHYGLENSTGTYNFIETGKDSTIYDEGDDVDIIAAQANRIKLKIDSGNYNDITAKTLYTYSSSNGTTYSAFSNVTHHLQNAALGIGKHTFTVANLTTNEGREATPGVFGGWSLIVIYKEDPFTGSPRNISIYNGFTSIGTNTDPISIKGFKLPSSQDLTAQMSVFSGEGEYRYGYRPGSTDDEDSMQLSDQKDSGYSNMPSNHPKNIFDGVLDGILRDDVTGHSNNLQINNDGVDIDTYDVSSLMEGYRTTNENIDEVFIKFYSNNDYITPSMVAFSAELYVPDLCYDYTLDIDGYVIDTVENNIVTTLGGFGKPLTIHAYIRSLEGDLDLTDFNITYTIQDTSHLTYQSGSSGVSEFGDYDYTDATSWTKNIGTSGFTMYLGDGKTSSSGGIISANEERYIRWNSDFVKSSVNTAFNFTAQFKVDYGSGAVPLLKNFNSADDLCPGGGSSYEPALGLFNLVDNSSNHNTYNLHTQVSGRPFELNLYAHDPANLSNLTPTDLNLSVEIEFVRVDHFIRDANTTCGDKDARLPNVPSKFTHIAGKSNSVTYAADELNFAYRNLAMRIKYLAYDDGTLIDNHYCTDVNQTACENLYARDSLSDCGTECAPNSSGCYACLMNHYGKLTCSRDNFSVRPETYVTHILDSNQSSDTTKPSNSIAFSKNGVSTNSGNLIAEYNYRFDINATSHNSDANVSHYIQTFNSPNSPKSFAKMFWSPNGHTVSGCNDPDDKNISVVLFNGSNVNPATNTAFINSVDQIGKYQFEIIDEDWTRADWEYDALEHHRKYSSNFSGQDCIPNSSTITASNNDVIQGCQINSVHTNTNTGASYTLLDMTYYPYSFDVSALQTGLGPQQETAVGVDDFLYMNTPNENDENMSLNIYGTFLAAGYNGGQVENFVANCFAQNVNMTMTKNDTTGEFLSYDLIDYNTTDTGNIIRPREQNTFTTTAALVITQNETDFEKTMQGAITMDLGYNYDRNITVPVEPRLVQFQDFNLTLATNPNISVDLVNNHQVFGDINIDSNISFVYGRLHAPRYRIDGNSGTLPLYYEVFCSTCTSSSLNWGGTIGRESVDSINWYQNPAHDNDLKGDVINFILPNSSYFSKSNRVNRDSGEFAYSGGNYPYKTTVDVNTSNWLIYDRYNNNAQTNYFELEFYQTGSWNNSNSGAKVDSDAATNTNRRIMW